MTLWLNLFSASTVLKSNKYAICCLSALVVRTVWDDVKQVLLKLPLLILKHLLVIDDYATRSSCA
uniref:Uncharacterized protein n=1 Tax=Aegilops tauschii subsp. strangulata TaxID=200361 RepID=A0A453SMS1_AEGTS